MFRTLGEEVLSDTNEDVGRGGGIAVRMKGKAHEPRGAILRSYSCK